MGLVGGGVLAPLSWLWRQLGPAVWVEMSERRRLFFLREEALAQSPAGATVNLGPSVYRLKGPLEIRQSIRLLGAGIHETTIIGSGEGYVLAFGGSGARFEAAAIQFQHDGTAPAAVFPPV